MVCFLSLINLKVPQFTYILFILFIDEVFLSLLDFIVGWLLVKGMEVYLFYNFCSWLFNGCLPLLVYFGWATFVMLF